MDIIEKVKSVNYFISELSTEEFELYVKTIVNNARN